MLIYTLLHADNSFTTDYNLEWSVKVNTFSNHQTVHFLTQVFLYEVENSKSWILISITPLTF